MTLPIRNIECFVFDMDGTLYLGERVIPGARELLALLDDRGIQYCFFTNNSSKSPQDYKLKLKRLGFSSNSHIITSGDVAASYLLKTYGPHPCAFVVGTPPLIEQLTAAGIDCQDTTRPDCVLVGFDTTYCFTKASRAVELLRDGVPFLATNIDAVCPLEDNKVLPDCSSICAMLTHATGVKPKYLGKPFAETARFIQQITNIPSEKTAVVGDRLYTDMQLALENGMCALGVLSGEMTREDIEQSPLRPHYLFDSVMDIFRILK